MSYNKPVIATPQTDLARRTFATSSPINDTMRNVELRIQDIARRAHECSVHISTHHGGIPQPSLPAAATTEAPFKDPFWVASHAPEDPVDAVRRTAGFIEGLRKHHRTVAAATSKPVDDLWDEPETKGKGVVAGPTSTVDAHMIATVLLIQAEEESHTQSDDTSLPRKRKKAERATMQGTDTIGGALVELRDVAKQMAIADGAVLHDILDSSLAKSRMKEHDATTHRQWRSTVAESALGSYATLMKARERLAGKQARLTAALREVDEALRDLTMDCALHQQECERFFDKVVALERLQAVLERIATVADDASANDELIELVTHGCE